VHLNVLFDGTAPEVDSRVVTRVFVRQVSCGVDLSSSRRSSRTEPAQFITVRDVPGAPDDIQRSGDVRVGDHSVVARRHGALGFGWLQSRDVIRRC